MTEENTAFAAGNAALLDENTTLRKEVSELKVKVAEERDKCKSLWRKFDDWYPMLQRAATWNGWSEQETLIQLAGHLRKRALLEWNLLEEKEKTSLSSVVVALRERLDPGSRSTAVHDFRYARQRESEPVGDLILRLKRTFRSAYGRDAMSSETASFMKGYCMNY